MDERFRLIRDASEEILTEEELRALLAKKKTLHCYDGFEPSGKDIHIAQGLLRALTINKMVRAGCRYTILVADWHAWANNKLGGSLPTIQTAGKYLIEVWKACGLDDAGVEFVWASDLITKEGYWKTVMEVARHSTVKRILRTAQIMGRSEGETLQASQILYPCMQVADIFHLGVDIAQLGMDQRKVNVLARELAPKIGKPKPVVVSHHILMGLGQPPPTSLSASERAMAMKMSKSKPETAIFMSDDTETVNAKIAKAYCLEGKVEENPVLDYCKHLLFRSLGILTIHRPEKYGGTLTFDSYATLEKAFGAKKVHPADLKKAVAHELNALLDPVRKRLAKSTKAKTLAASLSSAKITR